MKSTYKKILLAFLVVGGIASCKQKTADCDCEGKNKTEANANENGKSALPQERSIGKWSLNELTAAYYSKDKSMQVNKDSLVKEIINRHEVCGDEYRTYLNDFWGTNTVYSKPLDRTSLINMINQNSNADYFQFIFSKKKAADDFMYDLVEGHAFNSFVSCFSVVLIEDLINKGNFKKLSVTKGYQNIPAKMPPAAHEGNFYIAMLIFEDTAGNKRYFDIVSDPTISNSEPAKDCTNHQ